MSPVTSQCQLRVADVTGEYLLKMMMGKDKHLKKAAVVFAHELIDNSQVFSHLSGYRFTYVYTPCLNELKIVSALAL